MRNPVLANFCYLLNSFFLLYDFHYVLKKKFKWNAINQNLFLLKHYPNYVFNFEGGVGYAWMNGEKY